MNGPEGKPGLLTRMRAGIPELPQRIFRYALVPTVTAAAAYAAARTGADSAAFDYIKSHSGPVGAAAEKLHGEEEISGIVFDKAAADPQVLSANPIKWEKGLGPQDNLELSVDGSYLVAVLGSCGKDNVCPLNTFAVTRDEYNRLDFGQGVTFSKSRPHTRSAVIIRLAPVK